MSNYARLAVAAVAALAVIALGWALFIGRPLGPAATSSPTPTVGATPSAAPSSTAVSSGTPSSGRALTETFTSTLHGISIDYPAGWRSVPATEPWLAGLPENAVSGDYIFEKESDSMFLGLASQPLAGRSGDEWLTEVASDPGWTDTCPTQTEPVTVDGSSGSLIIHCGEFDGGPLLTALVVTADRGYSIVLYRSGDVDWFKEILATVQLSPPDALGRYEAEFRLPFSYLLPTGAMFDYGTTNETYFEVRVPAWADAGHPGGVILQAIDGGRTDPCDFSSSPLPIATGAQAVIDYLKNVPGVEVSDESAQTVGELPAVQASVVAGPGTSDCPNIWPWVEDTESFPQEVPLRVIAVDVGEEHLVFSIFGETDNPDWPAMADELIDSIRFEPTGSPGPSPTAG